MSNVSPLKCSFCGTSEHDVQLLTESTEACVCNTCAASAERKLIDSVCGVTTFGQLLTKEGIYPEDILRLTVGEFFDKLHTLVMKRLLPKKT